MEPEYRPPPRLDAAITAVYLAITCFSVYIFSDAPRELCILLGAIVGTAFAARFTNYLFLTCGRYLSGKYLKGAPFHDPLRKMTAAKKFADQGWQLAIHVSMTVLGSCVLSNETWMSRMASVWEEGGSELKFSGRMMYLVQLGIWIYTGFSCRFLELKRKDYIVMMLHHVVTIMLVSGSWYSGATRAGLLVMYVHDFSDIWIDSMKMANYAKLKGGPGYFLSEIIYGTGLLAWIYFRLYLFPKIIYSTFFESWAVPTPCEGIMCGWFWGSRHPFCAIQLSLLLCMHIYWFVLLLRIGLRSLRADGDLHKAAGKMYEGDSD